MGWRDPSVSLQSIGLIVDRNMSMEKVNDNVGRTVPEGHRDAHQIRRWHVDRRVYPAGLADGTGPGKNSGGIPIRQRMAPARTEGQAAGDDYPNLSDGSETGQPNTPPPGQRLEPRPDTHRDRRGFDAFHVLQRRPGDPGCLGHRQGSIRAERYRLHPAAGV